MATSCSPPAACARRLRWRFRPLLLGPVLLLGVIGCAPTPARVPPPVQTPDPRIALSEPRLNPRPTQAGAPVECSVEVANRSGQTLSRLILRCELLDAQGMPLGAGLGNVTNLPNGERRMVRTVVYGVRSFASARAQVSTATFQ
jgi:hypothetical protein